MILTRSLGFLENHLLMSEPEPPKDSFFFKVFEKSISIAEDVKNTDFLQAMKEGNLPPTNFGVLNVQDAYYCYHAADTYGSLLTKINREEEPELYTLVKSNYEGYVSYNETFFNVWRIPMASSVNPTQNFKDYAEHEHHVMCSQPSIYTLVAMLPCYYLWYWFSSQLRPDMSDDNLYLDWIEGSLSTGSAYRIGNFIDNWQKKGKEFDEQIATEIYQTSMNFEKKVFTEAYKQTSTSLSRGGV